MENSAQIPNPLLELHHSNNAEMQSYGELEIVSTFGQPQLEYAALHKSCGIMDLPYRGILELTGRDRLTFLNGLISNQTWDKNTKQPMPAGTSVYAFLLNLKGRIVADMNVIELGDRTLVEMNVELVEALMAVLDKYQFAEQVKMKSCVGSYFELAVHGPTALTSVRALAGDENLFKDKTVESTTIDGVPVVCWRDDPTGRDGVNIILPNDRAKEFWQKWTNVSGEEEAKIRPVGWAAFNACRIEAGRALFGIDFAGVSPASAYPDRKLREQANTDDAAPGVLPAETGGLFKRAINLNKCYIGQEIVARMYARQQSAKQIVGFRMLADALPMAGTPVLDKESNQVGIVTSSTASPVASNACIGLAFVKKPHFAIGTELTIPAEGAMQKAVVVELPLKL